MAQIYNTSLTQGVPPKEAKRNLVSIFQ